MMLEIIKKTAYLIQTLNGLENPNQYFEQLINANQYADWAISSGFFSYFNGWKIVWLIGVIILKIIFIICSLIYYCMNYLCGHLNLLSNRCDNLQARILKSNSTTVHVEPSEMRINNANQMRLNTVTKICSCDTSIDNKNTCQSKIS